MEGVYRQGKPKAVISWRQMIDNFFCAYAQFVLSLESKGTKTKDSQKFGIWSQASYEYNLVFPQFSHTQGVSGIPHISSHPQDMCRQTAYR